MVNLEIHVTEFCRLATGTGYRVALGCRAYAVFTHRFGKRDVTPLDGGAPPTEAERTEILEAVQRARRGYDWQGARE